MARTTAVSTDIGAVVAAIRSAIRAGELAPNQRLVEADLCGDYNASRSTVRSALAELTVEGLVERIQNRGARVRAVSKEEAIEIVEVRSAVEALCAGKAAERITGEGISELRGLARRMEESVAAGDLFGYSKANQELHQRIIDISGQRTAAATIERLRGQSVRYQFRLAMQPGRPAVSLPEHLAVVDAICSRNRPRAEEAMAAHLASVARAIEGSDDAARM